MLSFENVNLEILLKLDDISLEHACQTNWFVRDTCYSSYLWYLKCQQLYPNIPIFKLNNREWKALYYKLKFNKWTDIVRWSEQYAPEIMDWAQYLKQYENYVIYNQNRYMDTIDTLDTDEDMDIILLEYYRFIVNHKRFLIMHPKTRKELINMLKTNISEDVTEDIINAFLLELEFSGINNHTI